MSVTVLTSRESSSETPFDLSRSVFDFVCKTVGAAAGREGLVELEKWCSWSVQDGLLNFADMPAELNAAFGRLLRRSLSNGTIVREMLSWPISLEDTPEVLPENQTPEVLSHFKVAGAVPTLWRLADYLKRYERANS